MRTELNYDNAIYWANKQYELLRQQAALEVRIAALEYELDVKEKDILGVITSEMVDGKSKFTNEQSRKAELTHRLDIDENYQRRRTELNMLVKENLYLQREAKYAGKIVEIMCTFVQKQQEPLIPVPASLLSSLGGYDGSQKKMTVNIPDSSDFSADEDDISAA